MNRFFAPNLSRAGRLVRGLTGLALLGAAVLVSAQSVWLGAVLAGVGVFGLFEALRGWCALRACGIKTRL